MIHEITATIKGNNCNKERNNSNNEEMSVIIHEVNCNDESKKLE
jgi:hypothetical protein